MIISSCSHEVQLKCVSVAAYIHDMSTCVRHTYLNERCDLKHQSHNQMDWSLWCCYNTHTFPVMWVQAMSTTEKGERNRGRVWEREGKSVVVPHGHLTHIDMLQSTRQSFILNYSDAKCLNFFQICLRNCCSFMRSFSRLFLSLFPFRLRILGNSNPWTAKKNFTKNTRGDCSFDA